MVAPSGARLTKQDHPKLPVTLPEIVSTARACHAAGADGLHLHLRDAEGGHILDAGLYREALAELSRAVPSLAIQITTEAVGRYGVARQIDVALHSGAGLVSVALREILAKITPARAAAFYHQCHDQGIAVQHIVFGRADLENLQQVIALLPKAITPQILLVLGRYSDGAPSDPSALDTLLQAEIFKATDPDWAACAFGQPETACLRRARALGGKCRVGFENNRLNADGTVARDNAERVAEIAGFV